ncbi:MAG: CBS domain-containing protein [Acidimicrobiia bacterium]
MSPRAACRLESLGFSKVFDYVAGKADWLASGLPIEGTLANIPRVGDVARPDPPTCRLTDRIGEVRARVRDAGWDLCVVTTDDGIVLGRLRGEALESDPETPVEVVMEPGPSTQRPDMRLAPLAQRLRQRNVDNVVVTTVDGKLVGVVFREDVERLEEASRRAFWQECEGCPGTWRVQASSSL